jgi:hypothetical protein
MLPELGKMCNKAKEDAHVISQWQESHRRLSERLAAVELERDMYKSARNAGV